LCGEVNGIAWESATQIPIGIDPISYPSVLLSDLNYSHFAVFQIATSDIWVTNQTRLSTCRILKGLLDEGIALSLVLEGCRGAMAAKEASF
jgi:hypothetical protein